MSFSHPWGSSGLESLKPPHTVETQSNVEGLWAHSWPCLEAGEGGQFPHLSKEIFCLRRTTFLKGCMSGKSVLGYAKHFVQKERSRLTLFSSLIKIHLLWLVAYCPSQNWFSKAISRHTSVVSVIQEDGKMALKSFLTSKCGILWAVLWLWTFRVRNKIKNHNHMQLQCFYNSDNNIIHIQLQTRK